MYHVMSFQHLKQVVLTVFTSDKADQLSVFMRTAIIHRCAFQSVLREKCTEKSSCLELVKHRYELHKILKTGHGPDKTTLEVFQSRQGG